MQKRPAVAASFHHEETDQDVLVVFEKNRYPDDFLFAVKIEEFVKTGKFAEQLLQGSHGKKTRDFLHSERKW